MVVGEYGIRSLFEVVVEMLMLFQLRLNALLSTGARCSLYYISRQGVCPSILKRRLRSLSPILESAKLRCKVARDQSEESHSLEAITKLQSACVTCQLLNLERCFSFYIYTIKRYVVNYKPKGVGIQVGRVVTTQGTQHLTRGEAGRQASMYRQSTLCP